MSGHARTTKDTRSIPPGGPRGTRDSHAWPSTFRFFSAWPFRFFTSLDRWKKIARFFSFAPHVPIFLTFHSSFFDLAFPYSFFCLFVDERELWS